MLQIVPYEPAFTLCNEFEHMKRLSSERRQENSTEKTTGSRDKSDSVNVSTVKFMIKTDPMNIAIVFCKKWTKYKTCVCPFFSVSLISKFSRSEQTWYSKFIRNYTFLAQSNNSLINNFKRVKSYISFRMNHPLPYAMSQTYQMSLD